jgi:hypothetical protein
MNRVKGLIVLFIMGFSFSLMLAAYFLIVIPYSRLNRLIRQRRHEKPRIVWGSTPIIAIRFGSLAGRLYGYKSDSVVYWVSHLNTSSDYDYNFGEKLGKYFKSGGLIYRTFMALVLPYYVLLWASLRYDVFHYYFDGGFIPGTILGYKLEPLLLHLAGKSMIVVPYGGDARLESKTRRYPISFCMDCYPEIRECKERKIQENLDRYGKYANLILGCADLVDDLPRHDGIWLYPIDIADWQPVPVPENPGIVKVVHATNHWKYKGTKYLVAAVESLKAKGYPVELKLVEKMSNHEARKIYEQADIIADQFIGGAYAQFAMEGMALGRPVMCYLREDLYQHHPEWNECPIVNTNPNNIEQQLIKLITDKKLRLELGQKGPAYVKKYHSLEAVGANEDKYYRFLWNGEKKSW